MANQDEHQNGGTQPSPQSGLSHSSGLTEIVGAIAIGVVICLIIVVALWQLDVTNSPLSLFDTPTPTPWEPQRPAIPVTFTPTVTPDTPTPVTPPTDTPTPADTPTPTATPTITPTPTFTPLPTVEPGIKVSSYYPGMVNKTAERGWTGALGQWLKETVTLAAVGRVEVGVSFSDSTKYEMSVDGTSIEWTVPAVRVLSVQMLEKESAVIDSSGKWIPFLDAEGLELEAMAAAKEDLRSRIANDQELMTANQRFVELELKDLLRALGYQDITIRFQQPIRTASEE